MRSRERAPLPPKRDYAPEIELLRHQLTDITRRWSGVTPAPPSLSEAVEELTTTIDELHVINAELSQSQQTALRTQQRYQELFDWVPEAYLVTNLEGLIQEANRVAANLLNTALPRMVDLPLAVFIARDMRRSFHAQLAWLRNGAEVREWLIHVQPRHKPAVPMVCRVAPARDAAGQLIGLRWLLREFTGQQQVQETLEQRLHELTAELAQAHQALQDASKRAEMLQRETHHRMKNNLQVIAGLLDWHAENLQEPRARAILEACQGRMRAMALVHEGLYQTSNLMGIDLGHALGGLASQLCGAYGIDPARIRVKLQADEVYVAANTGILCGLLAHELLSNCLQHAFPAGQAGDITITLQAEAPGQLNLTIRDTGIGFSTGLDMPHQRSFGLQLIGALTEQLRGTITFTRDHGTCVTLRFPV